MKDYDEVTRKRLKRARRIRDTFAEATNHNGKHKKAPHIRKGNDLFVDIVFWPAFCIIGMIAIISGGGSCGSSDVGSNRSGGRGFDDFE